MVLRREVIMSALFKDLSGYCRENSLPRNKKSRLVRPLRMLLTVSRQLAAVAGTKLKALGMEKSELGRGLGPGVVERKKSRSA